MLGTEARKIRILRPVQLALRLRKGGGVNKQLDELEFIFLRRLEDGHRASTAYLRHHPNFACDSRQAYSVLKSLERRGYVERPEGGSSVYKFYWRITVSGREEITADTAEMAAA